MLLHPAHHHAGVARLEHHGHPVGAEVLHHGVRHLIGESLLDLEPAGEDIHHPRDLGQTHHRTVGQIAHVGMAEEGAAVRAAVGDKAQIRVLTGHMRGDTDMIADLNLTPILNTIDQINRHFEALPDHSFGLQLDTGMNRLGLEMQEWAAIGVDDVTDEARADSRLPRFFFSLIKLKKILASRKLF